MKDTDKKERESTPPPSYGSGRNYKEHPKFYTKDVFFQLDNTLYKFPEYYFRDSLVFRSLQTFRDDAGISGEGTFELPFTCTKIDRKALESYISLQRTAVHDQSRAISGNEALDILKVSYFWKMKKMGEFAVDQLSKVHLSGLEKMKLAKRYDIQNKAWRYSAIRELIILQKLSLTEIDVEIGVDIALKISKLHGMGRQRWFLPVSDEDIKNEFPELF